MTLSDQEVDLIRPVFFNALAYAGERLSEISANKVIVTESTLKLIHSDDISLLFSGNQKIISGTYLSFNSRENQESNDVSICGHLLLSFPIDSAYRLASILLQDLNVPLNKIQGMTNSIFGELGNIFGTGFLTFLANVAEIKLLPSVPSVINYKATSILEYVQDQLDDQDQTLLMMHTKIQLEKQPIEGEFLCFTKDYQNIKNLVLNMPKQES